MYQTGELIRLLAAIKEQHTINCFNIIWIVLTLDKQMAMVGHFTIKK